MQVPSNFLNPIRGSLVNRGYEALDDHWYFSVRQLFVWRISFGIFSISAFYFVSVTSVSSYQWIAFCIDFGDIFV